MCDTLERQRQPKIDVSPASQESPFVWSGILAIPWSLEALHLEVDIPEHTPCTVDSPPANSSECDSTSNEASGDDNTMSPHHSSDSDDTAASQQSPDVLEGYSEQPMMCSTLLLQTKDALLRVESMLSREASTPIGLIVDMVARLVETYWQWVQRAFPDREEALSASIKVPAWLKGMSDGLKDRTDGLKDVPDGPHAQTDACMPCIMVGTYVTDDEEARFVLIQLLQFRVGKLRVLLESVFGQDMSLVVTRGRDV